MVVEYLALYPRGQKGDKGDAGPAGSGFVKCSGFTHIPGIAGIFTPTVIGGGPIGPTGKKAPVTSQPDAICVQ